MTSVAHNQALDQLKEIHLPEPINLWPIAPGWLLLALITLGGLIAIGWFSYKRIAKNQYRRLAIKQLIMHFNDYKNHQSDRQLVVLVNRLLKTVAIQRYPSERCAGLSGHMWVTFLAHSSVGIKSIDTTVFAVLSVQYQPGVELTVKQRDQLQINALLWLKKHHDIASMEGESV